MINEYKSINKEKWTDDYFRNRNGTDVKRAKQFEIDGKIIKRHVPSGTICDVGCSTGEFMRALDWKGEIYGMEINDYAREKASDLISFERNIYTEQNFFDAVVFRGTIQHVDEPFGMLKASLNSIKSGGFLFIFSMINTNSLLYRIKGRVPALDLPRSYLLTGSNELSNALKNIGFEVVEVRHPYLGSPYSNPVFDHVRFLRNLFFPGFLPHAFWGSMFDIVARKKN